MYHIQGFQGSTRFGFDAERTADTLAEARREAKYMLSDDYRRASEATDRLAIVQIWRGDKLLEEHEGAPIVIQISREARDEYYVYVIAADHEAEGEGCFDSAAKAERHAEQLSKRLGCDWETNYGSWGHADRQSRRRR